MWLKNRKCRFKHIQTNIEQIAETSLNPGEKKDNWTWVKGAFHTVDRPYGPLAFRMFCFAKLWKVIHFTEVQ